MSDVMIYGSSDDLIEVDGDVTGCDEYSSEREVFTVLAGEGQVRVRVAYDDLGDGCWSIAIAPVDENTAMPEVVISQSVMRYSAVALVKGATRVIREKVSDAV